MMTNHRFRAERGEWRSEAETIVHEMRCYVGLMEHLACSELAISGDDLHAIESGLTRAIDRVEALLKAPDGTL